MPKDVVFNKSISKSIHTLSCFWRCGKLQLIYYVYLFTIYDISTYAESLLQVEAGGEIL